MFHPQLELFDLGGQGTIGGNIIEPFVQHYAIERLAECVHQLLPFVQGVDHHARAQQITQGAVLQRINVPVAPPFLPIESSLHHGFGTHVRIWQWQLKLLFAVTRKARQEIVVLGMTPVPDCGHGHHAPLASSKFRTNTSANASSRALECI